MFPNFRWGQPDLGLQAQVGWVKIVDFRPTSCYIAETVQDRDIV